jgi:hypothetical protein
MDQKPNGARKCGEVGRSCSLPKKPVRTEIAPDLEITVCHLPPGTGKWNKIEHRLFAHISMN